MDDNSAQNPQDNGLSVMYGQPFGKPKNSSSPQKKDSADQDQKDKVTTEKKEVRIYPDYANPDPKSFSDIEGNQTTENTEPTTSDSQDKSKSQTNLNTAIDTDVQNMSASNPPTTAAENDLPGILPSSVPPTTPVPNTGISSNDSATDDLSDKKEIDKLESDNTKHADQSTSQNLETTKEDNNQPAQPAVSETDVPSATPAPIRDDSPDDKTVESLDDLEPTLPTTQTDSQIEQDYTVNPTVDSLEELDQTDNQKDDSYKLPEESDFPSEEVPGVNTQNQPVNYDEITHVPKTPAPKEPIKIPEGPDIDEISKQVDEVSSQEAQSHQSRPMTIGEKLSQEVQPSTQSEPVQQDLSSEIPENEVQPPVQSDQVSKTDLIQPKEMSFPQSQQTIKDTPSIPDPLTENQVQPQDQPEPLKQDFLSETTQNEVQPSAERSQPLADLQAPTPDRVNQKKAQNKKIEKKGKSGRKLKNLNKTLSVVKIFGFLLLIGAVILVSMPSLPYLWYRISNGATAKETESISEPATGTGKESFSDVIEENNSEAELPEFDATLPYYNMLKILGIGVNGVIHQGDDPQASLEDGIWIVPELGTPETQATTILAAHRFGYITWDNDFRTKNSFFNLPKTEEGDAIEIIWNQRKYEYEIYKQEEGTSITDYNADLILYTCKLFNTPVRIFRYANRTN
jgi:sortase (surface protein transpeptidase)